MNHAKLETYYRIFDASIVPVCAGGCARLTEALAARLGRKVTDTARGAGAPRSAKAHPTVYNSGCEASGEAGRARGAWTS